MNGMLDFLMKGTESVVTGTMDILTGMFDSSQPVTYNAKFGDQADHISTYNLGFAITGSKALTKDRSHENCILLGPTGSGKSSIVITNSIVSLAKGKSSIIINDVSGELWKATSLHLANNGYKILRLDFSNSKASETFNPLALCKSISDIQKMSLLIIRNAIGESKSDPFWEQSSIMLISLFSRYLLFHAEPEYRTLQNVLRLIEKFSIDGEAVDRLFVKTNDEDLLNSYKATVAVGDKTQQSIIATARTALSLFCDPEVCKTTSTNSIDFSLLRNEPVALFVNNPLKDLMYFKPLSALFFQYLFNYVLSSIPDKHSRSVFFLLDESATMKFPALSTTISNIRKFRSGILLCMQDEMSLISQYGPAESHQIKTNCGTHIYLKGQPLHTCQQLSQMLGYRTIIDEKGIERKRELLTVDEIRMSEEAIIFIGNYEPLKCKMVPYYENIWRSGLGSQGSHPLPQTSVDEPALLPFT